jgi:hypothetical protein
MHCQMCKHRDRTYKILLSAKQRIINTQWVSSFFGTTHMMAKVDRTQNWLSPEQQVVAMDDIKIFVHERWHVEETEKQCSELGHGNCSR